MAEPTNESPPPSFSAGDILYVLFRHKWKIVLCGFAGVVAAGYISTRVAYTSYAEVLVRPFRESIDEHPAENTGPIVTPRSPWEAVIQAEVAILNSRELAEAVVDAIGPAEFLRDGDEEENKLERGVRAAKDLLKGNPKPLSARDKVVLGIRRSLSVQSTRDSTVISLAFASKDPILAQRVLNQVVEVYLERHLRIYRANGTYDFFAQQADQWRSRLTETENSLRETRREYGVASAEEQYRLLTARISELQRELEQSETALAAADARLDSLGSRETELVEAVDAPASPKPTRQVRSDPSRQRIRERLSNLHEQEAELLGKYTEDSTLVLNIRAQIAKAAAELHGVPAPALASDPATPLSRGPSMRNMEYLLDQADEEAMIAALRATVEAVRQQLATAQDELKDLIDAETTIAQLERERSVQESNYRTFAEGLERSRIDHALQDEKISNVSVLQPATMPLAPTGAKKRKNAMLALLLGLGAGFGLAFAGEFYLDRSVKRPGDVSRVFGLPTLVSIPRLASRKVSLARKNRGKGAAGDEGPTGQKWDIPADVRRAYENLCSRLILSGNGSTTKPMTIGVTSCYRGEGVSTVSSNLAAALCRQRSTRVLFVDAHAGDTGHKLLGSGSGPGLASLQPDASGNTIVMQQNQYLLAGGHSDNAPPSGHYGKDAFSSVCLQARENDYDYVVFDIPPVMDSSSGLELAGMMDQILLVVESERVRREVAERGHDLLAEVGAHVVGVVLNKRRFYVPGWLYRRV